jgi:hypothetical protein
LPDSDTSRAFTDEVPTSIPIEYITLG